jgi:hypothetical protein
MHLTVRATYTLKPGVNWAVVEFNTMVSGWFKFVRIKIFNDTSLPASPNRLLASGTTREDFYMHNVMSLRSQLRIEVNSAVEDKVTWLQLLKLKCDRKSVELVSLIPTVKIEA